MRHFYRTHVEPGQVLVAADRYFPSIGMPATDSGERDRVYAGLLGTMTLTARPEGGHYTLVTVDTDQMGESRLDRNVKRFFVRVHREADPTHRLAAAY